MFGLGGGEYENITGYEAGVGAYGGAEVPRVSAGAIGLVNLERLIATRQAHPEVITAANDQALRNAMGALPGESWSVRRHAAGLMSHCGNFVTLQRILVVLAAIIDEGRIRGPAHQHALAWHAYRVFESGALRPGHDLTWAWPLLGIPDPAGAPRLGLAPVESAGLAAYHRDRLVLENSQDGGRGSGGGGRERQSGGGGGGGDGQDRAAARAAAEAAKKAASAQRPKGDGKGGNPAGGPKDL